MKCASAQGPRALVRDRVKRTFGRPTKSTVGFQSEELLQTTPPETLQIAAGAHVPWLHINNRHFEGIVAAAECQGVGSLFTQRRALGNGVETYLSPTLGVTRFWPKGFDA